MFRSYQSKKHAEKGEKMTSDKEKIDHPSHYKGKGGLEVIDVIESFDLSFNLGNVIKYVLRAGKKGSFTEDRLDDLKKAEWYLSREINQQVLRCFSEKGCKSNSKAE